MKRHMPLVLTSIALLGAAFAQDGELYLLKQYEPKPGEVVVHKSFSNSEGGRMTITSKTSTERGTMSLTRSRLLERRLLGSGVKTQLQYRILSDQVTSITELGADKETESSSGALVGKTVFGFRDDMRRWRLFLKGQTANDQQAHDIAELEAYENRRVFMESPVRVGQTWPIDPSFIRHLTERDLGKAKVNATMTFKAVEMIGNEPTAVLDYKIETLGNKSGAEGGLTTGASAAFALTGTLHVALNTMLDKFLTLTGSLTTVATEGSRSTLITLPVDITVTKSVR